MDQNSILYKIGTATDEQVVTHLYKCGDVFIQELSKKTDIPAYSIKIVQNSTTFEAWESEALVGLVAAYFNDPENRTGFITNVSTVTGHMGKGIASELMKRCIAYAEENNFREIKLEVSAANEQAVKLYRKFNFTNLTVKDNLIVMIKNLI